MNKLKSGISLIILGNILYLVYIYFSKSLSTPVGDFTSGLLLGLSIGTNIIGIILSVIYISKNKE